MAASVSAGKHVCVTLACFQIQLPGFLQVLGVGPYDSLETRLRRQVCPILDEDDVLQSLEGEVWEAMCSSVKKFAQQNSPVQLL